MKLPELAKIAAETVAATQRQLPPDVQSVAQSVAVHFDGKPAQDVLDDGFESDILGLFTGDPHGTELNADNPMPPQILLYLENLWEFAEGDVRVFRQEVRITYLHELGHYLGWDEDDVTARGLD